MTNSLQITDLNDTIPFISVSVVLKCLSTDKQVLTEYSK